MGERKYLVKIRYYSSIFSVYFFKNILHLLFSGLSPVELQVDPISHLVEWLVFNAVTYMVIRIYELLLLCLGGLSTTTKPSTG
jgi:hypothetical protein